MHARRQGQRGLGVPLVEQMSCRQRGSEPEGRGGQQDVMHRGIDGADLPEAVDRCVKSRELL
jgi:hypothetical protein